MAALIIGRVGGVGVGGGGWGIRIDHVNTYFYRVQMLMLSFSPVMITFTKFMNFAQH